MTRVRVGVCQSQSLVCAADAVHCLTAAQRRQQTVTLQAGCAWCGWKGGRGKMADPIYRQIADDLRQKIESGELGHGDQLPTELELKDQYQASRNIIRDAVKWLITRGLVETRPGQGTFVVAKIDPYVTILTGEADASAGEGDIYIDEVRAELRKPTTTEA